MRWNNRYGRDYTQAWFARGGGRDFEPGRHEHMSWSRPHSSRRYDILDYDRQFRAAPDRSPTFGRDGDREVRRWARRHGYDEGFQIEPRPSSWMPAPASFGRDYGRAAGHGRPRGYGGEMGRGPSPWRGGYQW